MTLLDALIAPAHAQAAAAPAGAPSMLSTLLLPVVFIIVLYLFMLRPQMKRAKEHAAMLGKLAPGDEVVTNGGIAGVVRNIGDNFVTLEVADGVQLRVQRGAIANALPKGTLKAS